ncbi:2-oxo-hept-4-ene-1,7-dioate hydratase [Antarctobacter sp.]|uniref:2-oxo-hept-4-ene-1,7-dioate hydratase n=1 Tax=Antarctobacter sp. TaxID=1872577 RepID=UPI003A90F0C9
MLSDTDRQAAADAILKAEQTREVCVQPSTTWPGMTLEDAYDVQRRWAEARIAAGAKIVGRKIGLTSRAMQQASKMTEPDYGVILDDALFRDGARIASGTFIKPRLEAELAFVMGQDLKGAGCQVHDVLRATEYVTPALEIIDYRTMVPRQIVDTIADNAAYGAIVLGGRPVRPFDVDLRRIGATLSRNGCIEETGLSAGVMGHPAAGLAWLVDKLAALDDGLKAGDIVLGGSFTRPVDIRSGDVIHADYGPLGGIGVSFA